MRNFPDRLRETRRRVPKPRERKTLADCLWPGMPVREVRVRVKLDSVDWPEGKKQAVVCSIWQRRSVGNYELTDVEKLRMSELREMRAPGEQVCDVL